MWIRCVVGMGTDQKMRIGVLVTNYNYGRYLPDALGSVQAQNRRPEIVVVVDDGSTDDSLKIPKECTADIPCVLYAEDRNRGQLCAFQRAAVKLADESDVVCLLDADDFWSEGYLKGVEEEFHSYARPEMVFSGLRFVAATASAGSIVPTDVVPFTFDVGYGDQPADWLRTVFLGQWFGAPTSAIAVRSQLFAELVHIADGSDWRIRADDVLMFGGAARRLVRRWRSAPEAAVCYRIHGQNSFAGREPTASERRRRDLAVITLLRPYREAWRLFTAQERLECFQEEADAIFETLPAELASATCQSLVEAAATDPVDSARFRAELARIHVERQPVISE